MLPVEEERYERCRSCGCELPVAPLDLDVPQNIVGRQCGHCTVVAMRAGWAWAKWWEHWGTSHTREGC